MNIMVSSIIEHPAEVSAAATKDSPHRTEASEPATEASAPLTDVAFSSLNRPRRVSFRADRALEIIGHAIEYLSDESFRETSSGQEDRARLEAVQILMSVSRKIYFACPPARPLSERWHSFLHSNGG